MRGLGCVNTGSGQLNSLEIGGGGEEREIGGRKRNRESGETEGERDIERRGEIWRERERRGR